MNVQSYSFTKAELIDSINVYNNGEGISSYGWAVLNTINPFSTAGKGIFRCFVDSPQYKILQGFTQTKYFRKLDVNDTVSFRKFHKYVCKVGKEHRFDEIYMNQSNAVVKTIIKPWFESCCTVAERQEILSHNNKEYEKHPKSIRHHVSEIKDGYVSIVPNTVNAVLSPVETCKNLGYALSHPVSTLHEVKKLAHKRPTYVLGTALASASTGGVGMGGEYLLHATGAMEIAIMPQVTFALGVCDVAQEVLEVAHVGVLVSEMGESAKHHHKKDKKKPNIPRNPVSLEDGF